MKILLVTGGAGFIGSYFTKYFLSRNKNFIVINIDKLSNSRNLENIKSIEDSPRYHFIKGDICNYELVNYVLKKYRPDFIVNFASESQVDTVFQDYKSSNHSSSFAETSVMGTLTLLEGSKYIWSKRSLRGNRFVHVSSDDVYGNMKDSSTGTRYFLEESSLTPDDPFAASKAAADLMVMSYSKAYDLPAIITRSCKNYGPYEAKENFIPACISCAMQDNPIRINNSCINVREWMHVQDHCIAIIRALFYGKPGEIYNIGSEAENSYYDIAKTILNIMGKPEELIEIEENRSMDVKRYALNSYKSRNNLNWSSKYKLEDGLKSTIGWYKDHPSW